MWRGVNPAPTPRSPTTRVATAIAPKCQAAAARDWLADREAELLPVGYFHLVFTVPRAIADIAYQNKAVIYDLLFKASAETMLTIAAEPKHLGVRIGFTAVLHTWGSAMTHHPHIHMIVPGGGIAPAKGEEGASPTGTKPSQRWLSCRPRFFLSVHVLSHLFRRRLLEMLEAAHQSGRLKFFGKHKALADSPAFDAYLEPLRDAEWVVHAKQPFAGPEAVLAYLSRYTHRVAISNRLLIRIDKHTVTLSYKDYRSQGSERYRTVTLGTGEFIRRLPMHVLPKRFHRIRHYGLLANGNRAANIALARELLGQQPLADRPTETPQAETSEDPDASPTRAQACPHCGGPMIIIEVFEAGCQPKYRPTPQGIDSS